MVTSDKLEFTLSELNRLIDLLNKQHTYNTIDETIWAKVLKAKFDAQRGVHGPL